PVMTTSPAQPRPATAAAPPKGHGATPGEARLPVLHTIAAPAVIPSNIPSIDNVTSSGPIGVESGKENSTGSDVNAPAAAAPDASGPLVAGSGGVTSPVVIRKVEPLYPQV